MRRTILVICAVVCILPFHTKAQTVSGVVTDAGTQEVLIGASVICEGTTEATVTNAYGFYSLKLENGSRRLRCSHFG